MNLGYQHLQTKLQKEIQNLKETGLYKVEREIFSPQQIEIATATGKALNFCANNYLGFAQRQEVIDASIAGMNSYGFGLASVRFICGTQSPHLLLEKQIAHFLEVDDAILFSSCFDANGGVFEALLTEHDAVFSDALNHASLIDGIRLCKAKRCRYANNDMNDLEKQLEALHHVQIKLIVTDGVFSMDGSFAKLDQICKIAEKYEAMVMVDDSHAVGFIGKQGKGTAELFDVTDKVDLISGTLGKALGGASGGYIAGRQEVIQWLRQRARPYLFSNSLAPSIACATLKVFDMLESEGQALRQKIQDNSNYFRHEMTALGFHLLEGDHPIIPVMLGDAELAVQMADRLLQEGIYVIGFAYPVVPMNQARVRVQISAIHEKQHLQQAIDAFAKVGRELNIIS